MNQSKDIFGVKLGMWLFIFTEIILFAGLFVLYAAYFTRYQPDFVAGGKELSLIFGTVNTIILLCSSFFVAAAITAIQKKSQKKVIYFLVFAILLGLVFLLNKYFEWSHKIDIGIYPNSQLLTEGPPGLNIFYLLYYTITGLHGLHIVIGLTLLCISAFLVYKNRIHKNHFTILDNSGLYWHLVDVIWIFIYPLFYLII